MGLRGRTIGLHEDTQTRRAKAAFIEIRGEAEAEQRAALIAALPTVEWKGRTLYTIRCNGETGKGPHTVHLPERVFWALIDPFRYRCVYHA